MFIYLFISLLSKGKCRSQKHVVLHSHDPSPSEHLGIQTEKVKGENQIEMFLPIGKKYASGCPLFFLYNFFFEKKKITLYTPPFRISFFLNQ